MVKNDNLEKIYDNIKKNFTLIQGPCAVENEQMLRDIVEHLQDRSIYFRAGAFKPRTNPDSFQGLKEEALEIINKIQKENKDLIFTVEVTSSEKLPLYKDIEILQVGARNMQNYELLKDLAKTNKIILLKRGFGATVEELIGSAKYISELGNEKIILCERGIRTFSNTSRFTLDLSAVGYLQEKTNYPVFVDPSHAAGTREETVRLSLAAKAYGCDGLLVEVHPNPKNAMSDKDQQLYITQYKTLFEKLNLINVNDENLNKKR